MYTKPWLSLCVITTALLLSLGSELSLAKPPPAPTQVSPQVQTLQVRVTQAEGLALERIIYFALLKLALDKSGRAYDLKVTYVPETSPLMRVHTNPELINVFGRVVQRHLSKSFYRSEFLYYMACWVIVYF
ncbi:MAG: hypothetical protein E6Q84_03850 [Thiothrix sp.]|nr:MAG: hypothetical protein E6Q84_03850 [Thiothrix sp.]